MGNVVQMQSWLAERRVALFVALAAATIAIVAVGHVVDASSPGGPQRLRGTTAAETIFGTKDPDAIRGRSGADKLVGRRGDDLLFGGPGADKIRGGKGDDRLIGGRGGAVMIGGAGRDQFNMRDGVQIGGAGRDVIEARDGTADEINCGPGGKDVAIVDPSEDGIYNCERVVVPSGGDR